MYIGKYSMNFIFFLCFILTIFFLYYRKTENVKKYLEFYNKGMTIYNIAKEINFPPYLIARYKFNLYVNIINNIIFNGIIVVNN